MAEYGHGKCMAMAESGHGHSDNACPKISGFMGAAWSCTLLTRPETVPDQTQMINKAIKRAKGQFGLQVRIIGSNSASGYVAKVSLLKLNIGTGIFRLSSCMLSIRDEPYALGGKGAGPSPWPR